jgi:hypothetical protein
MDEHMIPIKELTHRLGGVDPDQGLRDDEVAEVYMRNGPNMFTPPKRPTESKIFFRILFSG